jgi:hypothetical protein
VGPINARLATRTMLQQFVGLASRRHGRQKDGSSCNEIFQTICPIAKRSRYQQGDLGARNRLKGQSL